MRHFLKCFDSVSIFSYGFWKEETINAKYNNGWRQIYFRGMPQIKPMGTTDNW